MVRNLDSLMRRAVLGGCFVFCSYPSVAPMSRAVAEDEIPRATTATTPMTAGPAVRQVVVRLRPAVPRYQVDYSYGVDARGYVFDRWFYVKRAMTRLQDTIGYTPITGNVPLMGHYNIVYPAYPSHHDAMDGRLPAAQRHGVSDAGPSSSGVRDQDNNSHPVLAKPVRTIFRRLSRPRR